MDDLTHSLIGEEIACTGIRGSSEGGGVGGGRERAGRTGVALDAADQELQDAHENHLPQPW